MLAKDIIIYFLNLLLRLGAGGRVPLLLDTVGTRRLGGGNVGLSNDGTEEGGTRLALFPSGDSRPLILDPSTT